MLMKNDHKKEEGVTGNILRHFILYCICVTSFVSGYVVTGKFDSDIFLSQISIDKRYFESLKAKIEKGEIASTKDAIDKIVGIKVSAANQYIFTPKLIVNKSERRNSRENKP